MLRDAFYIARMDARYLLTRRETIVWTFVMPVVFFYFIGAIGGNNGSSDSRSPLAVSVPADAGFLADRLTKASEPATTASSARILPRNSWHPAAASKSPPASPALSSPAIP